MGGGRRKAERGGGQQANTETTKKLKRHAALYRKITARKQRHSLFNREAGGGGEAIQGKDHSCQSSEGFTGEAWRYLNSSRSTAESK